MTDQAIIAGFGGQGILFMGKLIVQTMMQEGRHVTYFPSYGAEVRGGTANCHVHVSDEEIYSPMVSEATALVILNQPSYDRFAPILEEGGMMFLNTSLAQADERTKGRCVYAIPATTLAHELGNIRVANMVMMGAYNAVRKFVPTERLFESLREVLGARKQALVEVNERAIRQGEAIAAGWG